MFIKGLNSSFDEPESSLILINVNLQLCSTSNITCWSMMSSLWIVSSGWWGYPRWSLVRRWTMASDTLMILQSLAMSVHSISYNLININLLFKSSSWKDPSIRNSLSLESLSFFNCSSARITSSTIWCPCQLQVTYTLCRLSVPALCWLDRRIHQEAQVGRELLLPIR